MIVMTGANGRLGRALATALARRGFTDEVTLVTRDPAQVRDLTAQGFRCRTADYSDVRSLRAAFVGADRLFMVSATGPVEQRTVLHENAITAAADSGVGHLVYTSRVHPALSSLYPFARIHAVSEAMIVESGVPFTLLRNNEYAENLDRWLTPAAASGRFVFGGKGPIAFISRQDVIDSAVEVLVGRGHENRIYELSGPESLDRVQIAAVFSEALGRTIEATRGTREEFGAEMGKLGCPPFLVEMAEGLFDASEAGEWAEPSRDPAHLIGRPATPVSEHVRRVAQAISAPPPSPDEQGGTRPPGERTVWDAVGL
jgi:NAD(P)H dehydrogenase (quinone)